MFRVLPGAGVVLLGGASMSLAEGTVMHMPSAKLLGRIADKVGRGQTPHRGPYRTSARFTAHRTLCGHLSRDGRRLDQLPRHCE